MAAEATRIAKTIAALDATQYEQGVQKVEAAAGRAVNANERIRTATEKVERSQVASRNAIERVQRSLDSAYGSQQAYARQLGIIERAEQQGLITRQRSIDLTERLRQKYLQTDQAQDKLATGAGGLGAAFGKINTLLATLGVGLSAVGVVTFAKQALDAAGGLGELAEQLGTTTDNLQVYQFAAAQSGVKSQELEAGLTKLTRTIGDAAAGEKKAVEAFNEFGVQILDTSGKVRSTDDILRDLADRIAGIEDPAARGRAAFEFLGRSGQRLLPLLSQGAEGFDKMAASAKEAGAVLDAEYIARADEASDKLVALEFVLNKLATSLVIEVAPSWIEFLDMVDRIIRNQAGLKDFGVIADKLLFLVPGIGDALSALSKATDPRGVFESLGQAVDKARGPRPEVFGPPAPPFQRSVGVSNPAIKEDGKKLADAYANATAKLYEQIDGTIKLGQEGDRTFASLTEGANKYTAAQKEQLGGLHNLLAELKQVESASTQLKAATDAIYGDDAGGATGRVLKLVDAQGKLKSELEQASSALESVSLSEERRTAIADALAKKVEQLGDSHTAYQRALRQVDEELTKSNRSLRDQVETAELSNVKLKLEIQGGEGAKRAIAELTKQRELNRIEVQRTADVTEALVKIQAAEEKGDAELTSRLKDGLQVRQKLYDQLRDAVAQGPELERLAEESRRAAELWQEPFRNAISGIQSAFSSAFESIFSGGVKSFADLGKTILQIFIRLAAEIATLLVFKPVVGNILGSIGLGGLNQQLGLGQSAGGAGGLNFNLGGGDIFGSIGKLIRGETSLFGSSGGVGSIGGFGLPAGPGIVLDDFDNLSGLGPGSFADVGGVASSSFAGNIAAAGNPFGNVGNIGAQTAGAAGSGFGSVLPGIGTALSLFNFAQRPGIASGIGLVGSGLGLAASLIPALAPLGPIGLGIGALGAILSFTGVFGKKPTIGPTQGANFGVTNGRLSLSDFGVDNGADPAKAKEFADYWLGTLNSLAEAGGGTFRGVVGVGQSQKQGFRLNNLPNRPGIEQTFGDDASALIKTIFSDPEVIDGLSENFKIVLEKSSTKAVDEFIADLQFTGIFDKLFVPPEVIGPLQTATDALTKSYEEARAKAEELGLQGIDKLTERFEAARKKIGDDFIEGLDRSIAQLEGGVPAATFALADLREQIKGLADDAKAAGIDVGDRLSKLQTLQEAQIVGGLPLLEQLKVRGIPAETIDYITKSFGGGGVVNVGGGSGGNATLSQLVAVNDNTSALEALTESVTDLRTALELDSRLSPYTAARKAQIAEAAFTQAPGEQTGRQYLEALLGVVPRAGEEYGAAFQRVLGSLSGGGLESDAIRRGEMNRMQRMLSGDGRAFGSAYPSAWNENDILQYLMTGRGAGLQGPERVYSRPSFSWDFPGFATGGSFRVGGAGGTDSQLVQFYASPDETVSVDTPKDSRALARQMAALQRQMARVVAAVERQTGVMVEDGDKTRETLRKKAAKEARAVYGGERKAG